MKAINIILKGQPHKLGLRHYLITQAEESDINGYINYRQQCEELFIHAEGKHEAVDQFLFWLHNLSSELQIIMEFMQVSILECQDFRICCDASLLMDVSPTEYQSVVVETHVMNEEILESSIRVT